MMKQRPTCTTALERMSGVGVMVILSFLCAPLCSALPETDAPNLSPASAEAKVLPLPRIGVRRNPGAPGEFYRCDTGEPFLPKGFNHTVLERGATGWHATFNVGVYDPAKMDATLRAMAAAGANTIRVWAWGTQNASGFTGAPDSQGLNPAYMEDFLDFLRRSGRAGVYVVPILDETPHNPSYNAVAAQAEPVSGDGPIRGYNRNYLSPGPLAAKAAAAADFVRYIRDADPVLLNTVLGWSFANEVFVNNTQGPFDLSAGTVVTASGRAYDMAEDARRQACYDETIVHWANTLATAVKEVDPNALTTAGMWTSDAHGRPPVNYLHADGKDPRVPPRPSVLAAPECRLDFLDIHVYPWDGTSRVNRDAHEADAVIAAGKPVLVGEYGVFKNKTAAEARIMMRDMVEQAVSFGYRGGAALGLGPDDGGRADLERRGGRTGRLAYADRPAAQMRVPLSIPSAGAGRGPAPPGTPR